MCLCVIKFRTSLKISRDLSQRSLCVSKVGNTEVKQLTFLQASVFFIAHEMFYQNINNKKKEQMRIIMT